MDRVILENKRQVLSSQRKCHVLLSQLLWNALYNLLYRIWQRAEFSMILGRQRIAAPQRPHSILGGMSDGLARRREATQWSLLQHRGCRCHRGLHSDLRHIGICKSTCFAPQHWDFKRAYVQSQRFLGSTEVLEVWSFGSWIPYPEKHLEMLSGLKRLKRLLATNLVESIPPKYRSWSFRPV